MLWSCCIETNHSLKPGDDAGKIVREARVASEPEALLQVLTNTIDLKRIGLEAGPLSQWLYSIFAEAGLPVICVETRHMRDSFISLLRPNVLGYCAFAGASGRTAATPSGLMLKAKKVKGSPPGFPH
jgi:hypothetical protein